MFIAILVILVIVGGISLYFFIENNNQNKNITQYNKVYENQYKRKELLTDEEKYFYSLFKNFKDNYEIMPQVNLATVVKKLGNQKYQTELFRNIDFGIFSKNYEELLLLIEINDQTHNTYQRKKRDIKVRTICQIADIKLITFHTNFPNKPDYVINRIKNELQKIEDTKKEALIDDILGNLKTDKKDSAIQSTSISDNNFHSSNKSL